ncbi:hypothetical protein GCM10027155_04540 [Acinetobacter apis]
MFAIPIRLTQNISIHTQSITRLNSSAGCILYNINVNLVQQSHVLIEQLNFYFKLEIKNEVKILRYR